MVNYDFEILLLQRMKHAINYTNDNLLSLPSLRVRNIMHLLSNELTETIKVLQNEKEQQAKRKK